jgi:hypothetical protein
MKVKGLVIIESLHDHVLPPELVPLVTDRYDHQLEGADHVEILVLQVDELNVLSAAASLSKHLIAENYYAHFVWEKTLCIVFPHIICFALKENEVTIEHSKSVGRMFNIPDEQMPFEAMFEVDHPNE